MANSDPATRIPRYDRNFLLSPAKRNQAVKLWEVEKFGRDSFGDPHAVPLYGMRPAEWHAPAANAPSTAASSNTSPTFRGADAPS
jgi:hypothetical protein